MIYGILSEHDDAVDAEAARRDELREPLRWANATLRGQAVARAAGRKEDAHDRAEEEDQAATDQAVERAASAGQTTGAAAAADQAEGAVSVDQVGGPVSSAQAAGQAAERAAPAGRATGVVRRAAAQPYVFQQEKVLVRSRVKRSTRKVPPQRTTDEAQRPSPRPAAPTMQPTAAHRQGAPITPITPIIHMNTRLPRLPASTAPLPDGWTAEDLDLLEREIAGPAVPPPLAPAVAR